MGCSPEASVLDGLEVVPAFQPIVDLRDGALVGYEALARGAGGEAPDELFAAARAEGRLGEVDQACREAALGGTWTEVALGPGYRACFVARPDGDGWRFATSYDADLVVECALLLMARLPQAPR